MNTTVRSIVADYLRENGYDGLCTDGCGCDKDGLFLADYCGENCKPAYKHVDPDPDTCPRPCDALDECAKGGGFCYRTDKPEVL